MPGNSLKPYVHGIVLNLMPNLYIPKDVEKDVLELYDLYLMEEKARMQDLCADTWQRARTIFETLDYDRPYYIIFMVKEVSQKMQSFACQFMVCAAKSDGSVLKDCLVWYCDKSKNIFKLDKDLCDLSPKTLTAR